jgi:hypothetical protein
MDLLADAALVTGKPPSVFNELFNSFVCRFGLGWVWVCVHAELVTMQTLFFFFFNGMNIAQSKLGRQGFASCELHACMPRQRTYLTRMREAREDGYPAFLLHTSIAC